MKKKIKNLKKIYIINIMGPKPAVADTEMKFVTLKVVGGEPPSNAILSAKLSPYGCNPKKAG